MNNKYRLSIILFFSLGLLGCFTDQEILTVKTKTGEKAKNHQDNSSDTPVKSSILGLTPFIVTKYQSNTGQDPFRVPNRLTNTDKIIKNNHCWQPEQRDQTHPLEQFPLEKLTLKGLLASEATISALIQLPTGEIMPVRQGDNIGSNRGNVLAIEKDKVLINEIFPDGLGCWSDRQVTLTLNGTKS